MADKLEFFIAAPTPETPATFLRVEEIQGALPYLEHLMEEYETHDPLVLFSILYHYVLPTLQEQLTLHNEVEKTLLFPEFFHANLQKEIRIVGLLLKYFESTVLEKQQNIQEEKYTE